MADPAAIMRAAQAGPQKPAMDDQMEGSPEAGPAQPSGGLDQMVSTLEGVGAFLKAQGPKGQKAMAAFQALIQEMANMGGEGGPESPASEAPAMGSGRIHESQIPGVQVL